MTLLEDLSTALRALRQRPWHSGLTVAVLAVAIGGNTAIFSVANGLFLRPLPIDEPSRVVAISETAPEWNQERIPVANPDVHAWRDGNTTFEAIAVWRSENRNVARDGATVRVASSVVGYNLGALLGYRPVLGRDFVAADDRAGAEPVVLLGYDFWQREYAGDPAVINRTVALNAEPHTVVGVLPPDATFPPNRDLWVPLAMERDEDSGWFLRAVGRLRPDVALSTAQADLTRVHKNLVPSRSQNAITSPIVRPVREQFVGGYRDATMVFAVAVGLFLLVACATVAALSIARGLARRRDLAIRAALGAARGRLLRVLFLEHLLLVGAGASVAGVTAHWFVQTVTRVMPLEMPGFVTFDLDFRVLAFVVCLAFVVAMLGGLLPAVDLSRTDLMSVYRFGETGTPRRRGLQGVVGLQVGLATLLLVVSTLLVQAYVRVQAADLGFRPENVLTYQLELPETSYPDSAARVGFYERLLEATSAIPGVEASALIGTPPLTPRGNFGVFEVEGAMAQPPDVGAPSALQVIASAGYLEAIGSTVLHGRTLEDRDGRNETAPVVIVNETFARRFIGTDQAVGRRIRPATPGIPTGTNPWQTIVGVTRDITQFAVDGERGPAVYMPYRQAPVPWLGGVVRASTDPGALVNTIRATVSALDPGVPVHGERTMSEAIDESLWLRRAYSTVLTAFAGVAFILALSGVAGVVGHEVTRRTRELGIRVAIGASHRQVLVALLARPLTAVVVGVCAGLAGAVLTADRLADVLFGGVAINYLTYGAVAATVLLVALFAGLVPAKRAVALDPARVLRAE